MQSIADHKNSGGTRLVLDLRANGPCFALSHSASLPLMLACFGCLLARWRFALPAVVARQPGSAYPQSNLHPPALSSSGSLVRLCVRSGGGDICLGYATLKYIFPISDQWKPGPLYAGKGGVSANSWPLLSLIVSTALLPAGSPCAHSHFTPGLLRGAWLTRENVFRALCADQRCGPI